MVITRIMVPPTALFPEIIHHLHRAIIIAIPVATALQPEAIVALLTEATVEEGHSAEAIAVAVLVLAVALEAAIASGDVVKTLTSAFIIRCTSFMLHDA